MFVSLLFALVLQSSDASQTRLNDWPVWRGPLATGAAPEATPPTEWTEARNIRWKVRVPGDGTASPIVVGDVVFVLTAVDTGRVDPSLPRPEDQPKRVFGITHPNTTYRFEVHRLDAATGATVWSKVAFEKIPHEGHHGDASFASASPVCDGRRVVAWFGSAGLACYTRDGQQLWTRDLGPAYVGASLGEGASPALHGDRLVVVRDQARQSTIHCLDADTGQTIWEHDRDEPNNWATPLITTHAGTTQVITAGTNAVRAYRLDDGELLWQCRGLSENVTPSPVRFGDTVICMSGYQGFSAMAISLAARGDVTGTDAVVWSLDRDTPYVPSPVLLENRLYVLKSSSGVLSCFDAATGKTLVPRRRLPETPNIYASPVAANGHVYVCGRNGITSVFRDDGQLTLVAHNVLDGRVDASPAIAGDAMYLRTRQFLYCLADEATRDDSATGD